jgi:hypothetical protein
MDIRSAFTRNRRNMMNKLIITAALSGAGTFKQNNPAVPYTPQEFADEAEKAFKAGDWVMQFMADIISN